MQISNKTWLVGLGTLAITTVVYAAALTMQTAPKVAKERTAADFDVVNAIANQGITDSKTNLTWQACLVGQSYVNGACTGTATEFATFDDAEKAANGNWRLPTIKELTSISDHSTMYPAVNADVFAFAKGLDFDDTTVNPTLWSASVSPERHAGEAKMSYALALSNGEVVRVNINTGVADTRVQAKYVLLVKNTP
ncbi:MAG: DUF1566 domain-containing protein [Moraxella sp.]|nr:DUF1566 domain-containing protein [Moraxella sp.]